MRLFYFFGLCCLLSSCNLFDYHPYDGKVTGETDINAKNLAIIEEKFKDKSSVKFAFIGDTQRQYDETEAFVQHMSTRNDIDFVIHGGDISDFGLTREFLMMRDILQKLQVPYVVLIGNHDGLANGELVFNKVFGNPNFSFIAGQTKFICLNTNALEYDYSRPVPDFGFMERELADTSAAYKRTVVAMHAPPFNEQFNNNVAGVFQHYVKAYKNPLFCLNAHEHHLKVLDIYKDGLLYYTTPTIKEREFLVFTINSDDTYTHELVFY